MGEVVQLYAVEWRDVPGYDGYSVSEDGRIRGPMGRLMRPMTAHAGHLYVLTRRPDVTRKLYVHKAVLLAFIGPPRSGQECRHLDGDPANNHIDNLRWGTPQENSDDKQRHGTQPRGEESGGAKLTAAQVRELRSLAGTASTRRLGQQFGISHTQVRKILSGRHWSHLG